MKQLIRIAGDFANFIEKICIKNTLIEFLFYLQNFTLNMTHLELIFSQINNFSVKKVERFPL